MKRLAFIAALASAQALAACASAPAPQAAAPALDLKRVNQVKYEQDLAECRSIADQVTRPAPAPAGQSRAAAMGSGVVRVARAGIKTVAKTGGNVVAALPQMANSLSGQDSQARARGIVSNCLKGRGYRVLE
jgi:azurin